jgi:uncharacterized protein with HEPN domain
MRDKHEQRIKDYLLDILESIDLIEKYTMEFSEKDFFDSIQTQDAVSRRIGVIGEAANKLPITFREKYSDVAFGKAAGMRNILIHEYFDNDLKIIWDVIVKDLPKLKKQIVEILPSY